MSYYRIKEKTDNWLFCTTTESLEGLRIIAEKKNLDISIYGTILGWQYVVLSIKDLNDFDQFKRNVEQFGDIEPLGSERFEFDYREDWEHQLHEMLRINGIEFFEYDEIQQFVL